MDEDKTIFSKRHRASLSKALKGRVFTEEWIANISKARLGMKFSEETKKKMSDARKAYYARKREEKMQRENTPC